MVNVLAESLCPRWVEFVKVLGGIVRGDNLCRPRFVQVVDIWNSF